MVVAIVRGDVDAFGVVTVFVEVVSALFAVSIDAAATVVAVDAVTDVGSLGSAGLVVAGASAAVVRRTVLFLAGLLVSLCGSSKVRITPPSCMSRSPSQSSS